MKKIILHILLLSFLVSCIEHKPYDSSVEVDVISENKKDDILKGKILFENDCRVCHHIRGVINPSTIKVRMQEYKENYFDLFVTKQDSLYKANDTLMILIKNEWKGIANSHNFKYNKTELYQLKEYLKTF
ncbi:MAG: hypothetical protein WCY06_07320 [Flavobacteriaceae bacterium]